MSDYWKGLLNYKPTMKTTYTFKDFINELDERLGLEIGCTTSDLPDYPYNEDWETCAEDLAFIAPEDTQRMEQVFSNHVGYTVEDVMSENAIDIYPYSMPY
tara:strand:- start:167 stop:469 length:303 start_codon:yes stop_codon:yes gene_type:complete